MKALIVLLTVGSVMLGQAPAPTKSTAAKSTAAKSTAAKSAATSAPSPRLMTPSALTAKAPDLYRVKFTTTHGDFVVEVHRDWAPIGADRFYNLVRNRFYSDASFFRFVPNFMVQFGFSASPAVSKAWNNATIKDDPVKQSNKKGYITYAKTGDPNSRTTQVFINLKDNAFLDGQGFAPFGMVTEGMDIVEGLYGGYGDAASSGGHGPEQDRIASGGKAYLDKSFPKLDSVKTATVIFPEATAPAAPAKKSTAPPAKKSTAAPQK